MDMPQDLSVRTPHSGPDESPTRRMMKMDSENPAYYDNLRDERTTLKPNQTSHHVRTRAGSESSSEDDPYDEGLIEFRRQMRQDRRREVDFGVSAEMPSSGSNQSTMKNKRPPLPRIDIRPKHSTALPVPHPRRSAIPPPSMPYQGTSPVPRWPSPPPISHQGISPVPRWPPHPPMPHQGSSPFPRWPSPPPMSHQGTSPFPQWPPPPPMRWSPPPAQPTREKGQRSRFQNESHAKYMNHEDDRGLRLPPGLKNYEMNTYFDGLSAPDRSGKARYSAPSHERNVSRYDTEDLEGDITSSSSEDDEAWTDTRDSGSLYSSMQADTISSQIDAPPAIQLHSNLQSDEDLLNPLDWDRKLSIMERAVKESHNNRINWPDTWRHSDSKTCPSALGKEWPHILDVDRHVSELGLDAAIPVIDNSKWQLKRRGTLAEVVAAYKARLAHKNEYTVPAPPPLPSSTQGLTSWDSTCEQVQRLLIARDYLICVCRDAEYLNELHPTMDAITWFEQARNVNKAARSEVVELMSVRISQLSEIVRSLNLILRAILWGWSAKSTICMQSDQETASREEQDDLDGLNKVLKLESTRSRVKTLDKYANGEMRIQICIQTLELGLEAVIDEVEVFAAILSQALFYQCDLSISDDDVRGECVSYGLNGIPGLFFMPKGLNCMGGLIQDRNVWVLEQNPNEWETYPYISPPVTNPDVRVSRSLSYVRTTIVDLARIWGPIWQASGLGGGSLWLWYRLPGGYIGTPAPQSHKVTPETDEAPCHFSTTLDGTFGKCPTSQFFVPNSAYLLIGHGLPSALVHRKVCPTTFETGLEGLALQTTGTLKPFRYVDATVFNIAVGHSGAQASWNTQIKTNPGILMKQSLLDRWKLEPKFRNPRLLLLSYGLEVSCCTRNARRCRLVDLIRSRSMIAYLSAIYRPERGLEEYKTSLFEALNSSDENAFVELYDSRPEWQGELGTVVARCLEVVKESGVDKKGDLAAFAFMEKFYDPEQLAVLPRKDHTWIPMLEDSFDSATFAFISHQCLGYPRTPGQICRLKGRAEEGTKSVLETSFTSTKRSDLTRLFKRMQDNHRLTMRDLSRFRIKRRSSKGVLLGTWRGALWRSLRVPSTSTERFREKRQDGEKAIRVFVASRKRCRLPRLRRPSGAAPLDIASHHTDHFDNAVRNEPFSEPRHTARNPSESDPPSGTSADRLPRRESRSTMTDNTSTLRGDDASSSRPKSEDPTLKGMSPPQAFRIDASTQTDPLVANPRLTAAASPTQNGEFLLPLPPSPESDVGSSFTRFNHGRSASHDESSGRSSGRGHSRSASHGASSGRSSGHGHSRSGSRDETNGKPSGHRHKKDESLASKLGFR